MKDFEKTIKRKKEGDSSVVIGDSIEVSSLRSENQNLEQKRFKCIE